MSKTSYCWCWSIGENIVLSSTLLREISGGIIPDQTLSLAGGDSVAAVCRLIQKVEQLLLSSLEFRLPGKKQLYQNAYNWNVVVVDVTQSPIERPKKNSGLTTVVRKSSIPRKAQVVVDQATGQIICTAFGKGRVHDFRLFKLHRVPMLPEQLCLTDKGYQGIAKLHSSSCTPTLVAPQGEARKV